MIVEFARIVYKDGDVYEIGAYCFMAARNTVGR